MAYPPPPRPGSSSVFNGYLLITVATFIMLLIAIALLVSTCRCLACRFLTLPALWQCFGCWRKRKETKEAEGIPVCRYREEQSFSTECSVCLTAFEEGEKVRQLPGCRHSFHAPCVDMWLCSHSSCPSCRAPVPQARSGCQGTERGDEDLVHQVRRQPQQQAMEDREMVIAIAAAP
ncbi:hypothetical protein HPP92_026797 [Vanilla planifolia]|nr:hypothetical protein HPP92_026797 [Vanilla planifolia]